MATLENSKGRCISRLKCHTSLAASPEVVDFQTPRGTMPLTAEVWVGYKVEGGKKCFLRLPAAPLAHTEETHKHAHTSISRVTVSLPVTMVTP